MLVVGALLQIAAFLVQFLAVQVPFPAFVLSFALTGVGGVFQVNIIYILKELQPIISLLTRSSLHLGMASQLFKRTLNTNRVLYRLHLVQLSPHTPTLT
jgi:hypothetical protein